FSSRRRHTRSDRDWSSDVCSSDLTGLGGKGMRMVRTPRELEASLNVCRSEARSAFGDDSLYLERWLDETRHVEVQVAVDRYGRRSEERRVGKECRSGWWLT